MSTAVTPNLDSISLYFKEGTSDKEYHIRIEGDDTKGWTVNFAFGRRGSAMKYKPKNPVPVAYAAARGIFDEMLAERYRKGYTTGEAGTPYVGTELAGKVSGLLPMLLTVLDDSLVQAYIDDPEWVMQEKKDGVRQIIRKKGKVIEGINKKGIVVPLAETVIKAVEIALGFVDGVLDGELVGEVYYVFDILSVGLHAFTDKPYQTRIEEMDEWLTSSEHLQMVPTAIGKARKQAMYEKLQKDRAEGVVFKKLDQPYKVGRTQAIKKKKFLKSATVRVRTVNKSSAGADKQSVQIEMLSAIGGDWAVVGNCTIPVNQPMPKAGDYMEVGYLYVASVGGSLYQPTSTGIRTDVDSSDCLISQLVYKQGVENDDEEN